MTLHTLTSLPHTITDMNSDEVSTLMEKLRITSCRIEEITSAISTCSDDPRRDELTTELTTLQATERSTKTSLFDAWSKTATVGDQPTATASHSHTTASHEQTPTAHPIAVDNRPTHSTRLTARLTAPKEYKYGENFTTWSSRIKRYFRTTHISSNDAIELLLNSVDDRTLEKLAPVADKLTDKQKQDPDSFMPIFEQAMYPKSEIRALRQQLTGGQIVQEEDEDVDTYASRIRSLAKRAYSDPSERQEPCLNTFLCGIRDVTLYDKVISVPCAEDSFELAVESARKFETMRRSTRNITPEQIDVLRTYRVSSANDNNDNRNTETDNTNTNSDRLGQQDIPVDADRVHNNNSPARQNNQYQPRRGNYSYRGIDRHVHTDRGHNNNSSARQNNQYQPRRGNYSYRGNNRRDTWTCHLCQEQGHIVRFCPQLPAALNFLRAGNSNAGPTQQ